MVKTFAILGVRRSSLESEELSPIPFRNMHFKTQKTIIKYMLLTSNRQQKQTKSEPEIMKTDISKNPSNQTQQQFLRGNLWPQNSLNLTILKWETFSGLQPMTLQLCATDLSSSLVACCNILVLKDTHTHIYTACYHTKKLD